MCQVNTKKRLFLYLLDTGPLPCYNQAMIAGYVRVSTLDQVEYGRGLEIQKEAISEYCKKNGLTLDKFYEEHGVSGGLDKRPALAELQSDVSSGLIDTVIITRLDRLARNLLVQESILGDFQEKGASVISIDEPDILSIDPSRILLRQMKGAINQYEKAMIVIRMTSGRTKKAKDGGYAGGAPSLGYITKRETGKSPSYLSINSEEASTVELIYDLRNQGKTLKEIADYLNENNYRTKRNRTWYGSTVKYILENKLYKGFVDYSTIQAEGIHEPLIDQNFTPPHKDKSQADAIIISEKNKGASFRQIADKLNINHIPASRGGKWKAGTVKYLWDKRVSSKNN
jgi:site-specific DNA recombinase